MKASCTYAPAFKRRKRQNSHTGILFFLFGIRGPRILRSALKQVTSIRCCCSPWPFSSTNRVFLSLSFSSQPAATTSELIDPRLFDAPPLSSRPRALHRLPSPWTQLLPQQEATWIFQRPALGLQRLLHYILILLCPIHRMYASTPSLLQLPHSSSRTCLWAAHIRLHLL